MTLFDNFSATISKWLSSEQDSLSINGIAPEQWTYFFSEISQSHQLPLKKTSHLFLCRSLDEAEIFYEELKFFPNYEVYLFPVHDMSPYSGAIAPESYLFHLFKILDKLIIGERPIILLLTLEAILQKLPPAQFFLENKCDLQISDVISPEELAEKLYQLGYRHSSVVESPGTFSHKGEIFDIHPLSGRPVRLHYFDVMIEEIFPIDLDGFKTLRQTPLSSVHIGPAPAILSNQNFTRVLKSKIPMPAAHFKNKYEMRKYIFQQLNSGELFDNYPYFLPNFFDSASDLFSYFKNDLTLFSLFFDKDLLKGRPQFLIDLENEYSEELTKVESDTLSPGPGDLYFDSPAPFLLPFKKIYLSSFDINLQDSQWKIDLRLESSATYFLKNIGLIPNKFEFIKKILSFIKTEFFHNGQIVIACKGQNSRKEISYLLDTNEFGPQILKRVHFTNLHLESGFYYDQEKILVLSDSDFFSRKKSKAKRNYRKRVDLFAEQLATLRAGDFVIHNTYGIGEYQGLESIDVNGLKSDFLVLHYEDRDKVYVPVYKMNYIQKYAEAGMPVKVSSLKSKKFEMLKARAKQSVKALAFDLLKLQAERQSSVSFAFSPPDHLYNEFELAFPFEETPDQLQAIEDVISDMQLTRPMDRLICGDVGFGKTEVAMRAAFKAILDKKQVAILVPTTILALQHYSSFTSRFKDFPVIIEFLSRFKSPQESKKIISQLQEGKIDIVIGTHKLLASEIKFHDLGLVIIDEEQRFGVGHKEKMKLLKATVDFLTLTATPIPRTLQLSYLGIRDLSLIQTPPPKRQSIKSYVIKEDQKTIQQAIEYELSRGGQVFFVHNRVQDIERVASEIKDLVPLAKTVIVHGQMLEKDLEKRMKSFYLGESNVLVTTTIIESGLDIPTANTLIVNKAQNFGLSQLHQLRGRIGRSDKKAYAYFIIPKEKSLTTVADQRLKALQTYSDIGQGFSIASSDLEIRGAGDILGAEQSGHIESIGLELYTELLNEAIAELKGEQIMPKVDTEVHIPESAYIPQHYIKDAGERLKYYKKLSNSNSLPILEDLKNEFNDIFGAIPQELATLFSVLEVRVNLQKSGIKFIKVQHDKITLKFEKETVDRDPKLQERIVETFIKRPKIYKFNPDYSILYTHKGPVTQKDLIEFSKLIAEQIVPC